VMEELARVYDDGFAMPLHSDIVVPYLHSFGNDAQKQRWLPGTASGDLVTAVAMTEPGTGSDLAAVTTTARRDGDFYALDGSKTFISNGQLCDLCVVVAKTGGEDPHRAMSLFVVEAGTPGFHKGKLLDKLGLASQDTSELHFDGCRIPAANRLGDEGAGFLMLMQKLQQERLVVAIACQAAAEQVLADSAGLVERDALIARDLALAIREQAYFARDPLPQLGDRMTRDAFHLELVARGGVPLPAPPGARPAAPCADRNAVPDGRLSQVSDYVALIRDLSVLTPREALAEFDLDDAGYLEVATAWAQAIAGDPTLAAAIAAGLARR